MLPGGAAARSSSQMNMNIYLYYLNLEKPSNFLALFEDKKTANELFKLE